MVGIYTAMLYTVRPLFKKLHNTLKIWIYQLLCKKITQFVYSFAQLGIIFTQLVSIFTQQLVGSYVSKGCVNFLNSGLIVYTMHFLLFIIKLKL